MLVQPPSFRGCILMPVESKIANNCRALYFITSLISLSGYKLSKGMGLSARRLVFNLRTRLSLYADMAFVVAAPPKSLLVGDFCRVLRTDVSVFLSTTILLRRYALFAPDLTSPFLLVFALFSRLAYRPLDTQEGRFRRRLPGESHSGSTLTSFSKPYF